MKQKKGLFLSYIFLRTDKEIIQYMLENDSLEKALKKYKRYPKRSRNLISLLWILAEQDKDNRGLIVAVSCDEISVGVKILNSLMQIKIVLFIKQGEKIAHMLWHLLRKNIFVSLMMLQES